MDGSGQTILAAGSTSTLDLGILGRTLINRGTLTWSAGWLGMNEGLLRNEGTWTIVPEGSTSTVYLEAGPNSIVNTGTLEVIGGTANVAAGTAFANQADMSLSDGRFEASGALVNERRWVLGANSSSHASNNLILRPTSVLTVTVSGTAEGQFSSIVVGNHVDLAGTIQIQTDSGFVPQSGDEFFVLQYLLRTGVCTTNGSLKVQFAE
jgi:hypothetical protein